MNAMFVLLSAPSFSVRESDLWGGTTGTRQKSDIFKSCTNLKRSDDTSQFQKDQHRCNLSCSAVKIDSELSRNVRKVETRISGAFEALPIFSRSYQVAAKLQKKSGSADSLVTTFNTTSEGIYWHFVSGI